MRRVNIETTQLIIPIAGAGNFGRGRLSTAAPHLARLRHSLDDVEGRVVTQAIVPDGLGIFGSLDRIYEKFINQVGELTDDHPSAKVVLVGHSLGGLLGRRRTIEQPEAYEGVVTIGSPHKGINPKLPEHIRDAYEQFAASIPATLPSPGRRPQQAFMGSRFDEMVPLSSSLAEVPGATHYRVDMNNYFLPITHNALPVTRAVTHMATQLVNQMIGGPEMAEEAIAIPHNLLPLQRPA